MKSRSPKNRLRHFFAGLSEHVFQSRLGVVDPQLTDYITDMLLRFMRSDDLHRILRRRGCELNDIARMISEAEQRQHQDRREVHRQIGDMALFRTGIFPESLEANTGQQPESNQFSDYCWQGKRAYLIASRLQSSDTQNAPGAVLKRLADQFEMCALGLKTIRQQWKQTTGKADGASGILFT